MNRQTDSMRVASQYVTRSMRSGTRADHLIIPFFTSRSRPRHCAPPVSPQHPGVAPTRPVAATVGVAHRAPASMKKPNQPIRPPRNKDRTPLVRAGALLLMAGLLYLLWPSAETAYLAMESVLR